jgi:hypothetical protein
MRARRFRTNRLTEVLRRLEDTARFEPVAESSGVDFADGLYRLRPAADLATRRAAYRLVYSLYLEREYARPHPSRMWLSIFDALPETTTLVVERAGRVVAALTVIFDSPLGLPADRLYKPEIDTLRARGRRVAEIVSLGVDPRAKRGKQILVRLFNAVYLLARKIRGATDFVNTVNPRHAGFYKRTLLFERAGEEHDYDKVGGAPAVLLRLDLDRGEKYISRAHGPRESRPPARTLYGMFYSPQEEAIVTGKLKRSVRIMTERELRYFFAEKTALLKSAPARQRHHVEDCYPFYNLVLETTDTREYAPV